MVKQATVEFPDPFLNYKENGFTIALDGEETIDGAETFKIKLTKTASTGLTVSIEET